MMAARVSRVEEVLPIGALAEQNEKLKSVSLLTEEQLLAMLLSDPARRAAEEARSAYLDATERPPTHSFQRVEIEWRAACSTPPAGVAVHEISQAFAKELSVGRQRSFRLHRFVLLERDALNDELAAFACCQAARERGVELSNVGGFHSYQDLFDRPIGRRLRSISADCVRAAARLTCEEAEVESPREGSEPFAWINVSGSGHANQLHCHHGATLASCYYVHVPSTTSHLNGTLLFRPGGCAGASQGEPDEERHVRWMGPCAEVETGRACSGPDSGPAPVPYMELLPAAGTLVVFPAWLSHAVAPLSSSADEGQQRISVAANWDFQAPSDDFAAGWRWWQSSG